MKVIAEYDRTSYDADGDAIVSFKVPCYQHKQLLAEINHGEQLSLEVTKYKSKRSSEQNRYMWALLSEIDKARNGSRSNDEWFIYTEALERAGAKYEYIACLEAAEDMLKKAFRAVKFVRVYDESKKVNQYKCYYGSSKMNTKEMGNLIETVLDMASECGIEMSYWEAVLR